MTDPTGRLEDAADSLLAAIGERADAIGDGPLTLHWPLVGSQFDGGVLVIGQAVYGWYGDWAAPQARDAAQRQHIINEARDLFDDRPDRMDWIVGHRVWNSPFWRVARDVTDAVAPGPGPFYGRMAWANLYPVAPNEMKSNPRGALLEAQTEAAATFVDATIASLQPRMILVVGGPYIWPFVEFLGLGTLNAAARPLYLAGQRDGIDWVVGMHPGGASRRGLGPSRYAELIVDTARSLRSRSRSSYTRRRPV